MSHVTHLQATQQKLAAIAGNTVEDSLLKDAALQLVRATDCNTLQHTATHCNIQQHLDDSLLKDAALQLVRATHCNMLQHTATYSNTLMTCSSRTQPCNWCVQHAAPYCIMNLF